MGDTRDFALVNFSPSHPSPRIDQKNVESEKSVVKIVSLGETTTFSYGYSRPALSRGKLARTPGWIRPYGY